MPVDALLIVLVAAVIHAGWNAILSASPDAQAATAMAMVFGAVVFLVPGIVAWDIGTKAVPFLIAATLAETAYVILLAAAYARAEMSVVYPVARGSAPVLVLVATTPTLLQGLGVLVVVAGIVTVRGIKRPEAWADLALALTIGLSIATYTIIDKHGLEHASAVSYVEVELGLAALPLAGWLWWRHGSERLRAVSTWRTVLAGAGAFGSYGLILLALQRAPAAAVAAVRETSIVFVVVIAAVFLGESVTKSRALGAVVVAGGVALVAAG